MSIFIWAEARNYVLFIGIWNLNSSFYFIDLDDSDYHLGDEDRFLYHYSGLTKQKLAELFKKKLIENGLGPSRYSYRVD